MANFRKLRAIWLAWGALWAVAALAVSSAGGQEPAAAGTAPQVPSPVPDSAPAVAPGDVQEIEIALIDREPFDRITLDDFSGNAVMDIIPAAEPPSKPLPNAGMLIFEPINGDWQGELLQVPWEHVVDYQSFNELLLKEADQLLKDKKYSQAYRNILHVYDHGGRNDKNIVKQLRTVMYLDARENFNSGEYDLALTILEDIYQRDPEFLVPGANRRLIDMILDCHQKALEKLVEEGAFRGARQTLAYLQDIYADKAATLIEKWNREFERLHAETMVQARQTQAANDFLVARQLAQRALTILPGNADSIQFVNALIEQDPLVIVGVTQTAANPNPNRLEHWASRRVGRLTERRLVEFVGLAEEGGKYEFVSGRVFANDETGLVYRFVIEPQKIGFAIPRINAFQLAGQLLRYADAENPKCVVAWAKNVESVTVVDDLTVDVRLKVPLVRPEAYLSLPFANELGELQNSGAYVIGQQSDRITRFLPNPTYRSRSSGDDQLPQVAELLFENQSAAADALVRGEIDVLDRVSPNDLPRLRRESDIEVRSYLVPTVHMLVPNRRHEFMKDTLFRNGLMKSINRDQIMKGLIGRAADIDGTTVLNGPFPIGMENLDQIAYAYNNRIPLIPYNLQMGMALVETSRQARIAMLLKALPPEKANQPGATPDVKIPELVLAYPEGDVPSVACTAIAQTWRQIGVPTRLRKLPAGVTIPPDGDYDFLYVEILMTEPLADAEFLFGTTGLVRETNAAIEQITRLAAVSTSWRTASMHLRNLHRQVNNDMSVLPLWQMREFYAHRRNLRSVGRDLLFVYQNIDRWRLEQLRMPEEGQ